MVNDGVSIVTTTWNEWNNVEKLVVEIRKALRGHPHEIIVVDDSSTDGTIEVAKRFADVAVTKPEGGSKQRLALWNASGKIPRDRHDRCGFRERPPTHTSITTANRQV